MYVAWPVDQGAIAKVEYSLKRVTQDGALWNCFSKRDHEVMVFNDAVLVFIDEQVLKTCTMHSDEGCGLRCPR
ncbi:Uncharacterised protein [Mycobacteroides abscessus subsp. abscessus]|nr:Uncharacterised protein [Mycobacteroides abscessus subsp. abscessus]SHX12775.1 Uncharacterised protein [Mycobacteroides abscessus subsp. abscessus]SIA68713.1 Uncharacterised protein [Mycobacteroides abscessus subsp. abscessus]SII57873.1 Uncharacterised protein [Mycobacteroides abscessus subsp. abscessus]SIL33436.1 Uncharacterised protein [Mycobacteroides abscessus subsp. abscessus]